MCGIDVHMDPNIGKRLNALGNTLTTLTGEEDIDDIADLNSVNIADLSDEDEVDTMSPTIHTVSAFSVRDFKAGFSGKSGLTRAILCVVVAVVEEGRKVVISRSAFYSAVVCFIIMPLGNVP